MEKWCWHRTTLPNHRDRNPPDSKSEIGLAHFVRTLGGQESKTPRERASLLSVPNCEFQATVAHSARTCDVESVLSGGDDNHGLAGIGRVG